MTVQPADGVAPFLLSVDGASARVRIPGSQGAPIEVSFTTPVEFRGWLSHLPVWMKADADPLLELQGAKLLHPQAEGDHIFTDIDFGGVGVRAMRVKLSCAALSLDRLEPHQLELQGERWQSRQPSLILSSQPDGGTSLRIELDHPERIALVELQRLRNRVRVGFRQGHSGFTGWATLSDLTKWKGPRVFTLGGRACVGESSGDEIVLSAALPLFAEAKKGRWGTLAAGSYRVHRSGGSGWASIDHLEVELNGVRASVVEEPACPATPLRHAWISVAK